MAIIDLLLSPWAILPEQLRELQAIYATHLRGEKIDLAAIEARLGRPLANEQKRYQLQEGTGIAVLEMAGVIAPKANLFTRISGGAVASLLQAQVESMAADPKVKGAVIDMDSPGGNVLGIPALADAVRALAQAKPTATVSTGTMASAAYWIGSASNAVYISGSTDMVGSIGVVATHNFSPATDGSITTEITAGKYKRIASDSAPLSPEGRAYLQDQVDALYSVFVDAVASNRGASAADVLERMADGRVFVGRQAIDAGLVDGVATVGQIVEQMATNPAQFAARRRAVFASAGIGPAARGGTGASSGHATLSAVASTTASATAAAATAAAVAASAAPTQDPVPVPASAGASDGAGPGAAKATTSTGEPVTLAEPTSTVTGVHMTPIEAAAQFAADNPQAAATLRAEGGAAERSRIKGVREQLMPGHEALIEQLAADGATTPEQAAMAVNAAERARLSAMASARAADAPAPVAEPAVERAAPASAGHAYQAPAGFGVNAKRAEMHAQALAHMRANPGTDYLAAVRAVESNPAALEA